MKKILSLLLSLVMVSFAFSAICYAQNQVEVFFGDVPDEVNAGEEITLPIILTVPNVETSGVVIHISFDDKAFEYIKSTRGSHNLNVSVMGITMSDSSLLSGAYSSTNTADFSETTLCSPVFAVKEDAKPGSYKFEITKLDIEGLIGEEKYTNNGEFTTESVEITVINDAFPEDGEDENNNENIGTGEDEAGNENIEGGEDEGDNDNIDDTGDENTEENTDDTSEDTTEDKNNSSGNNSHTGNSNKEEVKEEQKPEIETAPAFTDLEGFEWATEYIMPLAKQGIIKGTSETTFAPGNNINRGDFMVLLMRLLEIDGETDEGFDDVPPEAYFANAVANAKKLGIAKGSDGKFNPHLQITREDLCVLVYRALNTMAYLPVLPDDGGFDTKYSDVSEISDYAYEAMRELSANEIIGGSDGMVNPKGYATRAETAVIIYRIQKLVPEF